MDSKIVMLNFDRSYLHQDFFKNESVQWIDFADMLGVHMFCEKQTAQQITAAFPENMDGKLAFLGGGNFHYVSYLLLSKITKPFSLVLFDHHTDMMPSPSEELISCGSWVLKALEKLPALQKVVLIGVNEQWQQQIPHEFLHKLSIFPKTTSIPIASVRQVIPTKNIYISLDKDVLALSEARTNWDQGTMLLNEVLSIIEVLAKESHLLGMDVCGEFPFTPQTAERTKTKIALRKNNFANSRILKAYKEIHTYHLSAQN